MKRGLLILSLGLISACSAPGSTDGGTGGGSANDGGSGGGSATGGGGGTVTRDGGTASAPAWVSGSAAVAGRTGSDLYLSFKATDKNVDIVSVMARLIDAQGADVATVPLALETKKWVGETLTATAWSRGQFATAQTVTQVGVTLLDATGLSTDEQVLDVAAQTVVARGASCDPTFLANRCEPGLGCRGTPPICDEGLAPQVTRLGFFKGANGPTILVDGTEPEDDLAMVRFEFQDATGHAISIDSDGDGNADLQMFEQPAERLATDGVFLMRLQAGVGLDAQVGKLVATAIDAAGHVGTPKTAAPSTLPVRTAGQSCDPKGFDVCGAGLSCSPGVVGATANKCSSAAPIRTQQCNAAPVLIPVAGGAHVVGSAEGGSLWDAPSGCATADPIGRPEGVVVLRLTDRADTVRVSTAGAGTNFDTVLYVLPGCPNDTTDVLACNDDVPQSNGASEVVLTNVPAGDYLVIIDSFDPNGGSFELHATLE